MRERRVSTDRQKSERVWIHLTFSLTVVKLGLFDKIEKPVAEVYCKNRQAWEPQLEGVAVIQGAA